MRIGKKIASVALCLAMATSLVSAPAVTAEAAAKKTTKATVRITKPTTKSTYTVNRASKNKTLTLKYSTTGGKVKSVSFKSSNAKVATVDKKGKITAKKAGTAKVTVTVKFTNKKTATDTVKIVVKQVASKITASVANTVSASGYYLVPKAKTKTISVKFSPSDVSSKKVTFKSSKTSVATVSSKGVITGKKAGTATITVTTTDSSKKSAKIKVKVVEPVKKVAINGGASSIALKTGKTSTLKVTYNPTASKVWGVKFKSSNTKVAVVNSTTGKIKGKKAGSATITATSNYSNKVLDTIKVVVKDPIEKINITNPVINLKTDNKRDTIKYTVSPSTAADEGVTFTSSNPSVVKVNTNGEVLGVGRGTATITVTSKENNKVVNQVTVNVTDANRTAVKFTTGTKVALTVSASDVANMVKDLDSAATLAKADFDALADKNLTVTVDGKKNYTMTYANGAFSYKDAAGKDVKAEIIKAAGKSAVISIPATGKVDSVLKVAESIQKMSAFQGKKYNYTLTVKGATKTYTFKNLAVSSQYTTFQDAAKTYQVYVEGNTLYVVGDMTNTTAGSNIFNDMAKDKIVTLQ